MNDSDLFESSANAMKEKDPITKDRMIELLAEELGIPVLKLKLVVLKVGDLIGAPTNKDDTVIVGKPLSCIDPSSVDIPMPLSHWSHEEGRRRGYCK